MGPITQAFYDRPPLLYVENNLVIGQTRAGFPCAEKPFHTHDTYVIEYIDTGSMWLIERKSQNHIPPGGYYVLRPDQEHTQKAMHDLRTLFIGIPPGQIEELSRTMFPSGRPQMLDPVYTRAQQSIYSLLAAMAAEVAQPDIVSRLMLESYCLQLCVQLLRQQQGNDEGRGLPVQRFSSPEIQRSIDFIHASYTQAVTLEQLASVASFSQFHFLRLFKKTTGFTPADYIRQLRLKEAAHLLTTSEESISAIASRLGFHSPGHFSQAFRSCYGVSPSQYRQQQ